LKPLSSRFAVGFAVSLVTFMAGCTGEVNNPPMPSVPSSVPAKVDTETPKTGASKEPYGASKKYQDLMNH